MAGFDPGEDRPGGGFAEWWNSSTGGQLLSIYVAPSVIPIWQIAMVVNAILAVGLYFFLRSAVNHIDHDAPYSDKLIGPPQGRRGCV